MFKLRLILFGILATHLSVGAQDFRPETEKLAVLERATQPWNAVHRWLIEYDCVIRPDPDLAHVRMIMATGKPGEYYKYKGKGFPGISWEIDPFSEDSFIHGGLYTMRWPVNRLYRELVLKPGDEIVGTISGDILWMVVPMCPMTQYQFPVSDMLNNVSPVLDRALRSAHYRLLRDTEPVNGETCFVFVLDATNLVRTTWVSTNSGLCVMKEEDRYRHSNALAQRLLVDEVGEVAPGLRLPIRYRFQRFQQQRETTVRILRCLLNDAVPDSTFVPNHAAGSIKGNPRGGEQVQVIQGGEDLLVERAEFITKYGPPTKASLAQAGMWIVAGLACGLGFALLLLMLPNKRRPSTSTIQINEASQR